MTDGTDDPKEYRGGVAEDGVEGVVPREDVDDLPPQDRSDPHTLPDAAMGETTGNDTSSIPRDGGDEADATKIGGTQDDVEDLEAGKPISRVDQANLAAQTDDV